MNPLSTSIPPCKAVSSEEGTPHTHTHQEGERREGVHILCRICLVVCCCCRCCLLLTWHRQELKLVSQPRLHPCPCAAAYQANKVHCLFAVFASHVCLLNCHRFWHWAESASVRGCVSKRVRCGGVCCMQVCVPELVCVCMPCALMHN